MSKPPPLAPASPAEIVGRDKIEAVHGIVDQATLEVAYQPIFDMKTGQVFAFEVLARCSSELFESVPALYRAAERAGRVGELGRLQRTLAVKSAPVRPLFVNVHPAEFDYGWLVRPDDPLFRHKEDVFLEITESAPLSYFEQCSSVLTELRKKGIRLAIDDLGAGFSNLKYIADLNPDIVKLDRELITGLRDGTRQFKLLFAIVQLCRDLGARVVAEGIETTEELVVAERAGVHYCQGYLLGRPDFPAREESWPGFR